MKKKARHSMHVPKRCSCLMKKAFAAVETEGRWEKPSLPLIKYKPKSGNISQTEKKIKRN